MSHRYAIVIPAFDEFEWIFKTLESIEIAFKKSGIQKNRLDVVVVVNAPQGLSTEESTKTIEHLNLKKHDLKYHILDFTLGLKNGVGEARALGMAYAVEELGLKDSDVLLSLDADTLLDPNYFTELEKVDVSARYGGFTLGFEHELTSPTMAFYELYLRYMKLGLSVAKSPYNFFTIGSALGTTVKMYKLSGGFMKRPATEDFHLLNKLRKLGPLAYFPKVKVYPSARKSNRVFLGTGHFLSNVTPESFSIPSPDNFKRLGELLLALNQDYDVTGTLRQVAQETALHDFLSEHGFYGKIESLQKNSKSRESYEKKLLSVIDGLQTLRILKVLQAKNTEPNQLLSWCQSLLAAKDQDAASLVRKFRERDLGEWPSPPSSWPWQNEAPSPVLRILPEN